MIRSSDAPEMGFCEPALAYAGAAASVSIAGATYAAFFTNSRRSFECWWATFCFSVLYQPAE